MIEILFVNKLEPNYTSMHSMGFAYSKANEGALYLDATGSATVQVTPPLGDVVAPGECVVY
jgi:manganese oxidase